MKIHDLVVLYMSMPCRSTDEIGFFHLKMLLGR